MENSQPKEAGGGEQKRAAEKEASSRLAADWGQSAGCFLRGTLTTADVTGRRAERHMKPGADGKGDKPIGRWDKGSDEEFDPGSG